MAATFTSGGQDFDFPQLLFLDDPLMGKQEVVSSYTQTPSLGVSDVIVLPTMLGWIADSQSSTPDFNNQPHHDGDKSSEVRLGCCVGYPAGSHHELVKAAEARLALASGAQHIVAVAHQGALAHNDSSTLLIELAALREAVPQPLTLTMLLYPATLSSIAITDYVALGRRAGVDGYYLAGDLTPTDGVTPSRLLAGVLRTLNDSAQLIVDESVGTGCSEVFDLLGATNIAFVQAR